MKTVLGCWLAALLLCAALQSRADDDEKPRAQVPSRVKLVNGAAVITLEAEARAKSGIETAHPASAELRPRLRAYARVLDPGPLTELAARYAAAQAALRSAQAKLAASQTGFERARALYRDERNASLAEVQSAEAAYRADRAAVSARSAEARSLAAAAEQTWGRTLGKALVEGAPLAAQLSEGRARLLQVTLPPGSALPKPPRKGFLETAEERRAPIGLVSPAPRTDPHIQGVSFFYTMAAASGVLPGMQLVAWLPYGTPRAGVVVPAQAVVWWQDRAWIYRASGPQSFTRLRIPTDEPAPDGGYLVADLAPDSEIVTRGAQLLLSEEFRSQIEVGD
jgi:hypothetical protein